MTTPSIRVRKPHRATPLPTRLPALLAIFLAFSAAIATAEDKPSVVRVNVTNQSWDFTRPWGKRQPSTRRAIGAVIAGPRVLVAAALVQNATYLEFEVPEGGRKVPAQIEFVDYECNLAILKTDDADFLKDIPPLAIADAKTTDELSVLQLEDNGRVLITKGPLTTAQTSPYPVDGIFLVYRMTVQIQTRDSSFTLPVAKDGKLAGVLMSYNAQNNDATLIPAEVIRHFLKDAADGKYDGFPRAGYAFSPTRDPALRNYAKIPKDITGGIYITEVRAGGPSAKAGLKRGDVLIGVDDFAVDQDGNYTDPVHGKISIGHHTGSHKFAGETVKLHILRDGAKQTLEATLDHKAPGAYVSDPYIVDRAPRFVILGGLILQELSRQWLREYTAGDQGRRTPDRLAYYDRYQDELFEKGPKKIVFLTRILPTPETVGYEEISNIVVKKINGVELQSLDDVAKAIEKPVNGFHEIDFAEDPNRIYLDAARTAEIERLVQARYRIPTMKRLE